MVRHLEHKRPAFWKIVYGVYQAACPCVKCFTATVELQRLAEDPTFEKLIVSRAYTNADRTNNPVERSNRAFRMVQKTRYKRRQPHTIEMAYWLHLTRDWHEHPLKVDPQARPCHLRRRPRKRRPHPKRHALIKRSLPTAQ